MDGIIGRHYWTPLMDAIDGRYLWTRIIQFINMDTINGWMSLVDGINEWHFNGCH